MVRFVKGKVWKFRDNVNTDLICPGPMMQLPLDKIGQAAMAGIDPNFYKKVSKGDIIVAGKNFGSGSSRELAPLAIKNCGIAAIVSEFFARIFFRNSIAMGFPILECIGISEKVSEGNILKLDLLKGTIQNLTKKETYYAKGHPKEFLDFFDSGGIIPWKKNRINEKK